MSSDTSVIFRLNLRRFTLMKENVVKDFLICKYSVKRKLLHIACLSCY